jgi:hypothetical protein
MTMAGINKAQNCYSRTKERNQRAFLAAFAETGVVYKAAEAAGLSRASHSNWMKQDSSYVEEFELLYEEVCQKLEAEAMRRAVDGYQEPVYQGGKLVGHKMKYSDNLLIFMLKAMRPEKYRERPAEGAVESVPQITVYIPDNGRD